MNFNVLQKDTDGQGSTEATESSEGHLGDNRNTSSMNQNEDCQQQQNKSNSQVSVYIIYCKVPYIYAFRINVL